MRARYYDPARGQFISQDPVFWSNRQNLANPQSLNSYSYAEDNPLVKKDPDGLAASNSAIVAIYQQLVSILQSYISILSGGGGGSVAGAQTASVGASAAPIPAGTGLNRSVAVPFSNSSYYNQQIAPTQRYLYQSRARYGPGNGPDVVDCSGAIIYGIRQNINPYFPDQTAQQLFDNYTVPMSAMPTAGTANFYRDDVGGPITHATTNVGNGMVTHPDSDPARMIVRQVSGNDLANYYQSHGGEVYTRQLDFQKIAITF
jgi:cell wall-associated NlpC family hydrolase